MSELGKIVAAKVRENEIESLRQQLAECQAREAKLREVLHWIASVTFDGNVMDAARKAMSIPNNESALNGLIAERTKELTAQLEALRNKYEPS